MLITNWTDAETEKFQSETFRIQHDLVSTGLFSDEALAELLDKHPKDQLDVCTIGNHPIYKFKFRTGDPRDVDGKTLIEAVKAGTIWMNIRKAMNLHPEYNAVLEKMYGELATLTGKKPFHARGGILVSSPAAHVPFHCDATETILWHIRGQKRVLLYPRTEEFLPDEYYELMMFRLSEDYLPYNDTMEEAVETFDLEEGEMLTWPLNRPHRVENKSYCVSVTTEYSTHESSIKNAAMYTNAVLRRKLGRNPHWRSASMPEKYIKAGLGKVLKKVGVLDTAHQDDMVSFKIDKTLPGYIRDIEPFVRTF